MIHDGDDFHFSSPQEAFNIFSVLSLLATEWILFYNAIFFSFSKFIFKMKSNNHNFIENITTIYQITQIIFKKKRKMEN